MFSILHIPDECWIREEVGDCPECKKNQYQRARYYRDDDFHELVGMVERCFGCGLKRITDADGKKVDRILVAGILLKFDQQLTGDQAGEEFDELFSSLRKFFVDDPED